MDDKLDYIHYLRRKIASTPHSGLDDLRAALDDWAADPENYAAARRIAGR